MAAERFPLNGWQTGGNARLRRRQNFTPQMFRRPYGAPPLAREEFFGAQQQGGDVNLTGVGGISGAEAFGVPGALLMLSGIAIDSGESVGGASIVLSLSPSSVGGMDGFGTPAVGFTVVAATVAGDEVFGEPAATLTLSGLALQEESDEAGAVSLALGIWPVSGIASAEAFGWAYAGGAEDEPHEAPRALDGFFFQPALPRRRNDARLEAVEISFAGGIYSEESFGIPTITLAGRSIQRWEQQRRTYRGQLQ